MAEHGFWNHAQREPSVLALVDADGGTRTRGELLAACNRIVHGLRAIGLGKGDCVAAVLPNDPALIELYLAVSQAGMYLVPINWHLAAPEIAYIVGDSEARVLVAHERFADTVTRAADELGFPSPSSPPASPTARPPSAPPAPS